MNALLDDFLVGLVLLVSLGYACYRLGPRLLRKRFLEGLGRLMAAAPAFLRLRRLSQSLAAVSDGKAAGACGGCDNCGTEPSQAAQSSSQASSAEIRVPVAKIGRRA
jgi:hypothetical protein